MHYRQNHYVFVCCVILKIFFQYSPALDYHVSALINFPLLIFLYLYVFSFGSSIALKKLFAVFPIYVVPLLSVCASAWGDISIINIVYLILQWLVWPLATFFAVEHLSNKSQKLIATSFIICFAITAVTTYIGCLQFPDAARSQANSNFAENNSDILALYKSLNIGSFLFVYTAVPMIPLLLYSYRNKILNKWLIGIILIMLFVCIYKTQYATAFLLQLIALTILLLPLNLTPNNIRKRLVVIIILSILCLPILSLCFDFLASSVNSEVLSQRFQELSLFSNNDSSLSNDTDLGVRFRLWTNSIRGFLEHPITGCYILGKEETLKWLGGHSFILDFMCRFGILGLFLIVFMFKRIYKLFLKPYKHHPIYIYAYIVYWINIIQCLVNTTTAEVIFVFLIPLLVAVSDNRKIKYTIK